MNTGNVEWYKVGQVKWVKNDEVVPSVKLLTHMSLRSAITLNSYTVCVHTQRVHIFLYIVFEDYT